MLGNAFRALSSRSRNRIIGTLVESVKDSPKRQFKFHQKLGTSKYNEFLEHSDDEEVFRTKPRNAEGKDFDFGFKIDAFRDQIRFRRNGSDKQFQFNTVPSLANMQSK